MSAHIQPSLFRSHTLDLVNLIYDAALQPNLWQQVLETIRIYCGADQCTLFYYDSLQQRHNYAAAARTDEATLNLYLKEFIAQQAAQINNQLAKLPEGVVVSNQDIHHLTGSDYSVVVGDKYMNTLWPNLHFQAGAVLLRGTASCAGLGLQNFGGSPSLTQDALKLLQSITPHLRQAMYMRQRISMQEHANHAFEVVLKHVQLGVILLDADYRITFINPAAKNSLAKSACFSHELHQPLRITNLTHSQWDELFTPGPTQRKGKRICQGTGHCMKLDYINGQLKLNAFRIGRDTHKVALTSGFNGLPQDSHYLLLVQDSQRPCELPMQYLERAYAITPAEAELIYALVNGATLSEAADQRAVTKETARWQLKHIMQKTGTHSQTELSRLMLALCDA